MYIHTDDQALNYWAIIEAHQTADDSRYQVRFDAMRIGQLIFGARLLWLPIGIDIRL
jgi:hypothetical protein